MRIFGSRSAGGFLALLAFNSNHDFKLDKRDDKWGDLRVWMDTNKDAACSQKELQTLDQLKIKAIWLDSEQPSEKLIAGNEIKRTGYFAYADRRKGQLASVALTRDPTNSLVTGEYVLDPRVLWLPTIRGYGTLPDLSVAMSMDSSLLDLMLILRSKTLGELFASPHETENDFEQVLFTWAKVTGAAPDSRGPNIDARIIGFMEKFIGEDFRQQGAGGTHR
jgi:hypothetical protein